MTFYTRLFFNLLLFIPASLSSQTQVSQALSTLVADPDLRSAGISFKAVNLKTGATIAEYDPHRALIPASVTKVISTGAALLVLGPEHRFTTELCAGGKADDRGVLHGDLFIIGGGDPTLGSVLFYDDPDAFLDQYVLAVKEAGIKQVNGAVVADDRIFPAEIPPTWSWGDIANYYGAGASGLAIFDNSYQLTFRTGAVGKEAVITGFDPAVDGLAIESEVVAAPGNADNAYIFGAPYTWERVVRGTIPANRSAFTIKGSIPDPALVVARLLKIRLETAGIPVMGGVRVLRDAALKTPDAISLFKTNSPPVAEVIRETNMRSLNPYAESMLLHTSLKLSGSADLQVATEVITRFWESRGMDVSGFFLQDGSGLSRANAYAASHLIAIMSALYNSPHAEVFLASLPVAGRSGSLSSMLRGTRAEDNLRAKSGYMSRVRSYTGYVNSAAGDPIVFAFLVNNYSCSASAMRKKMESVMAALAQ